MYLSISAISPHPRGDLTIFLVPSLKFFIAKQYNIIALTITFTTIAIQNSTSNSLLGPVDIVEI